MFCGHSLLGRCDSWQPGTVEQLGLSFQPDCSELQPRQIQTTNVPLQLELRPMIQAGVAGFKCFLIHSGVDEFPHVTDFDLHTAMKQLQGTGSVLLVTHKFKHLPQHTHTD